jgi:hypothetical protein
LIHGGFVFNLHKLLNFQKVISITSGMRTESSNRGGVNAVSLSSSLIDVGLDVEVLTDLHLVGGVKFFKVSGNEIQSGRNGLNQIITFGPGVNFNQTQSIIASGLRYDYGTGGYFSMHYHIVNFEDKLLPNTKYNLNQWFFVFGLKF